MLTAGQKKRIRGHEYAGVETLDRWPALKVSWASIAVVSRAKRVAEYISNLRPGSNGSLRDRVCRLD